VTDDESYSYIEHNELVLDWAKQNKQTLVEQEGVGQDIPPTLIVRDGETYLVTTCPDIDALMMGAIAAQLIKPESVTIVTEIFHLIGQSPFSIDMATLRERFAQGDPYVVEAITVVTAARDVDFATSTAWYRYEGRELTWQQEPQRVGVDGSMFELHLQACCNVTVPNDVQEAVDEHVGDKFGRWAFLAQNIARNIHCEVEIALVSGEEGFNPNELLNTNINLN
jgi:hypothetical protein